MSSLLGKGVNEFIAVPIATVFIGTEDVLLAGEGGQRVQRRSACHLLDDAFTHTGREENISFDRHRDCRLVRWQALAPPHPVQWSLVETHKRLTRVVPHLRALKKKKIIVLNFSHDIPCYPMQLSRPGAPGTN